jgi:foldase protein PrsA
MKKLIIIAVGLALTMSAAGCKRAGDVLVSYKGGQITRGEFYDWIEARRMAKDAIIKKRGQQKTHLERLATEKLVVRDAVKAGFDKSEEFQYIKSHIIRKFYSQYMGKIVSTEGKFSEKAAKTSIIKLTAKNFKIENNKREKLSDAETEKVINEKMEKAREIIKDLEKGKSFTELAKNYSDDFSKRKGGELGYVIDGMRGEDFSRAVFAVKKGTFTREPVKIGDAVYIIKVDDVVKLTESNIEDLIDDKIQQLSLKRRLAYNTALHYQDELIKAKDVENNIDTVNYNNPAAVIFKVGKSEFTATDMNKLIGLIMQKRKKMGRPDMMIEEKMKRELAKNFLREEVLMREAKKRGLDKDEKFKKELGYYLDFNLAGMYETDVVLSDITVTPQEVRDYYTKNLDRMYTRNLNEGGKTVKKVMPFEEVRQSIDRRLYDMKRSEKRKNWVAELLSKNNFKIDDSELEGK